MLYIQSNAVPRDLHKGVALSSTDKIAARRLYSLAGAWLHDGDGDPLNLRFAPSTDHFKRKRVLANKNLGPSDKSRRRPEAQDQGTVLYWWRAGGPA